MKHPSLFFRIATLILACMLGGGATVVALPVGAADEARLSILRPALELSLGETDTLVPTVTGKANGYTVTFESSDPAVVAVDEKGNLTAKKIGHATITVTLAGTNQAVNCSVTVIEKEHSFDDQIMITIFWPPTAAYINDEQFKLMADAGITQVMGAGPDQGSVEVQGKMLELCAKYGMGLTIEDGSGWNFQSEERIAELIRRYHNVPAAYGFYLIDEPFNANSFVSTYVGIKKQEPNAYVHLNFLPEGAYGATTYRAQMTDYARLCADAGYPLDYLMFDNYPFGLEEGSMWREGFFSNLRSVHDVGLKEEVKTGLYIQTVRQDVSFRRPTDAEIRYEMYASLAFGYKQLSFFTWFTPSGRNEPFSDGIISADGKPNAHYEAIKTINHEIHAMEAILVKCDAREIYFGGPDTYGQPAVPYDFFVKPAEDDSVILSYLYNRETGHSYLMVVNNDFTNPQEVTLTFDDAIKSLSEVSRADGALKPLAMSGQVLSLSLAAGDGMLIALPEDFVRYKAPEGQPAATVNLAADGRIYASSSPGDFGYYIYYLNDSLRFSAGPERAWSSVGREDAYIKVDLGRTLDFNRVDIYPAGNMLNFGENFPVNAEISVSNDGVDWRVVKTCTGLAVKDDKGVQIDIDKQTARYIRVDMKDIPEGNTCVALNEIEVYCDDGTVPPPSAFNLLGEQKIITYTEGQDLALGKEAFASSTYEAYGFSLSQINDGNTGSSWTSGINRHTTPDATEYVGIDFGDRFAVDRVVIYPSAAGFPQNYVLELSLDGQTWIEISKIEGFQHKRGQPIVVSLGDPVPARFVRMTGTKLSSGGAARDGYLFQLAALEAYGSPICDTAPLQAALEAFRAEGGDTTSALYGEAVAGAENSCLTQSQADDLTKRLYAAIGYNPDGTDPTPDTAPDTVGETIDPSGTASGSETTSPDTDTPSRGCGSALAAGAVPLAMAIGAYALYKRKED